jgi:sugar phosphate permease
MEELKRAERRLVRTLDARLILPIIIIYIMNYLDRNAISAAKVAGIEDDLELTDSQYQTSVSIHFVGYGLSPSILKPL